VRNSEPAEPRDQASPAELKRADYAVSANVARTIDATRQAVIDTRSCVDWLIGQGYERIGLVGTSLGSCYGFLASVHDPRIEVNVFNHCSTYFADVVWEGLSSQHIRQSLESSVTLEQLRDAWSAIRACLSRTVCSLNAHRSLLRPVIHLAQSRVCFRALNDPDSTWEE